MADADTNPPSPWGNFTVEEGETGYWRIGPLELWIQNLRYEWRLYHRQQDDDQPHQTQLPQAAPEAPPEDCSQLRFSFDKPGSRLSLTPVLADRPVVIKPEGAFYVPSGEEATLFVSTPVWVRFQLESVGQLYELPSQRPSDTWFGPSTLVGEFCYASRTAGRLALEELEFRAHRAITPIRVKNRAHDALFFEKVKLPVQYLSVYQAETQFLWTEAVTLERAEAGEMAALNISHQAPRQAGPTERLGPARLQGGRNIVVRAFSRLFRGE